MNRCSDCKYCDYDLDFDGEDEYEILICEKGFECSDTYFTDCEHFEEYKPEPYVEEDTKCDKCDKLQECQENGNVIRITHSNDTREHYVTGRGNNCIKRPKSDFEEHCIHCDELNKCLLQVQAMHMQLGEPIPVNEEGERVAFECRKGKFKITV